MRTLLTKLCLEDYMNFGLPYATLVSIAPTQKSTHLRRTRRISGFKLLTSLSCQRPYIAYIVQERETSKPCTFLLCGRYAYPKAIPNGTMLITTHATEILASTVLSHPHCSVSKVLETPPATCKARYATAEHQAYPATRPRTHKLN